ncbi:MAG: cytochrome P450 [Actinomycetota bacterium]|jgi:cytochrome P450|nr:cytochrome P450 [Actinomycetota bacterium]|tara:strand:+ start:4569 stop:5834 length:1266 start_codon:yes stop_codon:yes gene_type:complete
MRNWNTTHSNLMDPLFWLQPAAECDLAIARLHAEAPLDWFEEPLPENPYLQAGPGYWCVTRHEDIATVSRNPQIYSSAQGITITDTPPEFLEFFSSMIAMDDPRHARLRRIISKGFTPRMLGALEESVQNVAAAIVNEIGERGECDFVTDVAAALPLKIVCDLMGVPDSAYEMVFANTNIILGIGDPEFAPEGVDFVTALLNAGAELAELMGEVAATKKGGDGGDLTSVLVNADLEDDYLDEADLASFFVLLVVAGNETTRNAISWGLRYLTDNPAERAIWASDFEGVAATAVEEIVRLASPVTYMRRTLTQDTVLGGQEISSGEKVAMFYLAANRDPAVFDDPYRFDVRRAPNPQYGYGGPGPHFCLGAHLARREITVLFRELFRTLPDIHAAENPDPLQSSFIHGVKHMKAEFTPVRSS